MKIKNIVVILAVLFVVSSPMYGYIVSDDVKTFTGIVSVNLETGKIVFDNKVINVDIKNERFFTQLKRIDVTKPVFIMYKVSGKNNVLIRINNVDTDSSCSKK